MSQSKVCGLPCEVYSRVVGYLRPVQQWNAGKKAEYMQRRAFRSEAAPEVDTRPLRDRYSEETLVGWGF